MTRKHGTLTRWNDDRGFGFITPAGNTADIFVHVSAFPHEGGRPRLNELISFETEAGADGRQRAVRIMRPAQSRSAGTRQRPNAMRQPGKSRSWGTREKIVLLCLLAIAIYGYSVLTRTLQQPPALTSDLPVREAAPSPYSCDGRTMCSQMTSCAEAAFFIRNCPGTQMDGNGDGVPCERQWCN